MASTDSVTSVALVDDHCVVRAGIKHILEESGEFEVVVEAGDGRTAVAQVLRARPQIVLMEVSLPKLSGVEATRQILDAFPACKIVILSQHESSNVIEAALRAGATGYVHKSAEASEVVTAARAASKGKGYLSPGIASQVVHALAQPPEERALDGASLSRREREVLQLVAEGLSSKEVAAELGVSTRTAETHRGSLMNKLGIHKVAGLVRFAVREGIVTP